MINENKAMALGALTAPASEEDAVARLAEYTASEPTTGMIGLKFASVYQFTHALRETGWKILEEKSILSSDMAETISIKAKQVVTLRILVNQFRNGSADVINTAEVDGLIDEDIWK